MPQSCLDLPMFTMVKSRSYPSAPPLRLRRGRRRRQGVAAGGSSAMDHGNRRGEAIRCDDLLPQADCFPPTCGVRQSGCFI
ncbi:hypothetical protein TIFTF001_016738 [Ficus carica]|uniref:Uncharacterized protein n=1 Tax=Ficus carica TaxID=3494 RepID=A0AA88A822_FICCA|nr:hypothetical protein TIFTF001_016738 [Ficus carica]